MDLTVVCGSDPDVIRETRARFYDDASTALGAAGAVERLDAALDGGSGLLDAVGSPSLFGGVRVVEVHNFDALAPEVGARLSELAPQSDARVLARAERLSAAQRAALPPHVFVDARAPSPYEAARRLRAYAAAREVRLDAATAATIVERTRHAPGRATSVVDACVRVGLHRPRPEQVATLLGATRPTPMAFAVVEHCENGQLNAALEAVRDLPADVAFALCASLRKSLVHLVALVDGTDPGTARARSGATERRATLLGRLSPTSGALRVALDAVLAAEDALRASVDPGPALDAAVVRYAQACTRPG